MKVLKSWLKDFIKIDLSDKELSDKLVSISGFDLESVKKSIDDKIIVGEIRDVKPHPNADRLRLATVFDGESELEIVCGAANIEAGQKVPLAKIGAKVGDTKIQKTSIRGVESNGMLCSERELLIGEDHTGIKILPDAAEIGAPALNYLESDVVFDLEVTPNRGDCLSHLGIAREIAAFTQQRVNTPLVVIPAPDRVEGKTPVFDFAQTQSRVGRTGIHKTIQPSISGPLSGSGVTNIEVGVKIEDPDLCPCYHALEIKDVKIAPSPEWLQKRLAALGVKPINNIVDITNYIMMDMGQPLHAFDAAKVAAKTIVVRRSREEIFTALDGKARELGSDMLVIADTDKPIALAGIMGGIESGVTEATTDIILEAALFEPKNIRKTSKSLGLATDASYRFERGVDPLGIEIALYKAASLIMENAGGTLAGEMAKAGEGYEQKSIEIPYNRINNLLGLSLHNNEIDRILISLGFTVQEASGNNLSVTQFSNCLIPSWRHDIALWQDLAEEVGRIYGYDKVPNNPVSTTKLPETSLYHTKESLKDILAGHGFSEVNNYPFLSEADLLTAQLAPGDMLEVANPVQQENRYLRGSLVPGLLKVVAKNPAFDPVLIFEVGSVFSGQDEQTMLCVMASGKGAELAIKNFSAELENRLKLPSGFISIKQFDGNKLSRFKIRKAAVYYFELPVLALANVQPGSNRPVLLRPEMKRPLRSISLFPSITRDIAMIIDETIEPETVINELYAVSPAVVLVELFDEFTSPKFGHGKKSLAFHLFFQHKDRTLKDAEADDIMGTVADKLRKSYGAEIR